jgi:hypothetical protein
MVGDGIVIQWVAPHLDYVAAFDNAEADLAV